MDAEGVGKSDMRNLILCLAAPLSAAACATSGPSAPINYAGRTPPPAIRPAVVPPVPVASAYDSAPKAIPAGLLRACPGGGSNLGPIGLNGVSMLYTPYILANQVSLIRNPTERSCLSSGFGERALASGGGKSHTGVDFANAAGGYVFAAADGRVDYVGQRGDYGLVMELDHGASVHTIYAHLSETDPALAPGGRVRAGAAIGRMGMTGNATGVHLHYEVIVDGAKVDPLKYGQPAQPEPQPIS